MNKLKLLPYYLIAFLGEIYFIIPIWLFFYLRVISYEQLAILIVVQTISSVLLEIPTGAFADIVGKKITLVISFFTYSLVLLAYTVSSSFLFFLVLEIVKGFAKAMYSGSFEAMVYDNLKSSGLENKYNSLIADFTSLAWIALFISAYTGGFLFTLSPTLPYILTGITYFFVGLIFVFYTSEPKVDTLKYQFSLNNYLKQNVLGFKELVSSKHVALVSCFIMVITFSYLMTSEFLGLSQAQDYNIKPEFVGILFGSAYIISAGVSQLYKKLTTIFSEIHLLSTYTIVAVISLIFARCVSVELGSLLILSRIALSTLYLNSKSVLLNKNISSKNRATTLSTLNLITLIPYSIVLLIGGKYIQQTSPNIFAYWLGIAIIILLGILIISYKLLNLAKSPKEE